jgi:hypothetical protein
MCSLGALLLCPQRTDGTQPGAPDKSALQAATLTAGELLALLAGTIE